MSAYCDDCGQATPLAWYYGHACEARVTDAELDERIAHYQRYRTDRGHAARTSWFSSRASLRYAIAWRKLREGETSS